MYALPYWVLTKLRTMAIDARRKDRTWRYFMWSIAAGLCTGFALAIAVAFVAMMFAFGIGWAGILAIGLMGVPLVAQAFARRIAVRFGWYRVAYHAGRIGAGADPDALGLALAAAAFAGKPSDAAERFVTVRRDQRTPLGDAEVVATAFLLAGRGDADTARQLLRSTTWLVESHPAVRELAGEWLAVDAAERRAWAELCTDAAAARWPATPLTFFLEGVAARHVGAAGMPSKLDLQARWLLAPHRRATRRLLDEPAASVPVGEAELGQLEPALTPADGIVVGVTLPHAIAAHLAFTAAPSAAAFARAVRAWDLALADATTQTWLARRALELDAPLGAVDRALRDTSAAIVDELARLAETAQLGAPKSNGSVGDRLAHRLRHGRLDGLEQAFTHWAERIVDHDTSRTGIDEWRELVALRVAYTAVAQAGGLELRRLAFPIAYFRGSNMSAWLWNQRREYVISHAISVWLLDEALLVGDAEAIEHSSRNCKLAVPTRLGQIRTH